MAPTRTARHTSSTRGQSPGTISTPNAHHQSPSAMSHPTTPPAHTPLFPASHSTLTPRPSHHKKRPPSHIPRPPNAFILFRTNFIRDRHLHTSAAGALSHVSPTSLSTIAGLTWRNMPEEERQIWVERARVAREEHRRRYPSYRYQPVPTAEERSQIRETKRKVKEENLAKPDLQRCQEISRLLCMGIKGDELEQRIAQFDQRRQGTPSIVAPQPTRSASLPTIPSPPPFQGGSARQRSYSTSDASYLEPPASGADAEYDALPDTPELLPGDGGLQAYEPLGSVAQHTLPELGYDSASPGSISLPDPQESVYVPSSSSSFAEYTMSPHTITQPLPSTAHPLTAANPPHETTMAQQYPTSFSTLTHWEHGAPPNEPAYLHFPYFASTRYTTNTNHINPTSSPFMPMNDPSMTSQNLNGSNETTHPYASSISPFELHRKLRPFEQPYSSEYPELSSNLQTFDARNPYLNPVF